MCSYCGETRHLEARCFVNKYVAAPQAREKEREAHQVQTPSPGYYPGYVEAYPPGYPPPGPSAPDFYSRNREQERCDRLLGSMLIHFIFSPKLLPIRHGPSRLSFITQTKVGVDKSSFNSSVDFGIYPSSGPQFSSCHAASTFSRSLYSLLWIETNEQVIVPRTCIPQSCHMSCRSILSGQVK